MTLWYLSFADDEGWRGGVVLPADSFTEALQAACELGLNPGGNVMGEQVPTGEQLPPRAIGTLYRTREELAEGLQRGVQTFLERLAQ